MFSPELEEKMEGIRNQDLRASTMLQPEFTEQLDGDDEAQTSMLIFFDEFEIKLLDEIFLEQEYYIDSFIDNLRQDPKLKQYFYISEMFWDYITDIIIKDKPEKQKSLVYKVLFFHFINEEVSEFSDETMEILTNCYEFLKQNFHKHHYNKTFLLLLLNSPIPKFSITCDDITEYIVPDIYKVQITDLYFLSQITQQKDNGLIKYLQNNKIDYVTCFIKSSLTIAYYITILYERLECLELNLTKILGTNNLNQLDKTKQKLLLRFNILKPQRRIP